MNPLSALARTEARDASLSWQDYLQLFTYNGHQYLAGLRQTLTQNKEPIGNHFEGYARAAYQRNGIVFAVMQVRLLLFSEARFMFRRLNEGRPGDLFWTPDLQVLSRPWPGATTGDLLARAIQDVDLAGNFYGWRNPLQPDRIQRLRPDWVEIVLLEREDGTLDVAGYEYHPKGVRAGEVKEIPAGEMVHFAPTPDPLASYRGMSWLTPIVREIQADSAATSHKLKFFENGATPNLLVKSPVSDPEVFKKWVSIMEEKHAGVANAYRTMYLGAGADATVVGTNFQQLDFKVTQGAGETRIAAAGGVPPVVVGLSEGLQGSSLNAGNYGQARRRLSDGTLRPLWRNLAGSMANVINVPADAELWYDDRDIRFLQEDLADAANIQSTRSQSIRTLVDAGFTPASAIAAVTNDDLTLLEHTNLYSVQLQPPGTSSPTPETPDV